MARRGRADAWRACLALSLVALVAQGLLACQAVLGLDKLSEEPNDGADSGLGPPSSTNDGGDEGNMTIVVKTDSGPPSDDGAPADVVAPSSVDPSCANAATTMNCGGITPSDCCATGTVGTGDSGTTYYRTYQADGEGGVSGAADEATITGFRLDAYEVTVSRFRAYVGWLEAQAQDGGDEGGAPSAGSGKHTHLNGGQGLATAGTASGFETGWDASWDTFLTQGPFAGAEFADDTCSTTYTQSAGAAETLPMNCLSWYDAYAFCIWDGGFLPSEAEWELAAAGGSAQLLYPWGSSPISSAYATYGCSDDSTTCLTPVGVTSAGVGAFGQYDLLGNVSEWVIDNGSSSLSDSCTDCADLNPSDDSGMKKITRGGDFTDGASDTELSVQGRVPIDPGSRSASIGVRCARAPLP